MMYIPQMLAEYIQYSLHSLDDPPFFVFLTFSCIYVYYVGLCVLWVLMGPAKLHCGATPPSVSLHWIYFKEFSTG